MDTDHVQAPEHGGYVPASDTDVVLATQSGLLARGQLPAGRTSAAECFDYGVDQELNDGAGQLSREKQ